MKLHKHLWPYLVMCILCAAIRPIQAIAQQNPGAAKTGSQTATALRDGQHDFDFNFGTWKAHISRLQHPLTGSTAWVEYDGISVVSKVWAGRTRVCY